MIRLAISSAQIPSALYVRGVDIGTGRVNPDEFGGFADIFTGMHCGRRVAVKRLRAHGTIKRDLFKVRCYTPSTVFLTEVSSSDAVS
jgi:hypothetical protein